MKRFSSIEALNDALGTTVGPTPWLEIDQSRIDAFADATNDHQWIHVDQIRAKTGPFGATIAHGYLTLSLISGFFYELFTIETSGMQVNYGLNKVRFPAPVPVKSKLRATATFVSLEEHQLGHMLTTEFVIEIEHQDRPACIAQVLTLLVSSDS